MNNPVLRKTTLVRDEPAVTDEFGAHARIAQAIHDLISCEDGGRTIALTGAYGAGKSTVIRLLEARSAGNDRKIWIFDAWSHEGDPLRRTFLESLTNFLVIAKWIEEKTWTERKEALAKRRKSTTIETHPKLTTPGLLLALALLLTPFAATVLAASLRNGEVLRFGLPSDVSDLAATLLLLPFMLALFKTTQALVHAHGKLDKALNEIGRLVLQKEGLSQQTDTLESTDPTSLEFEGYFTDIMAEALSDKARQLVLVIDNLDRVDPEHAVRIWSTLRTFLDPAGAASRTEWVKRLWVVIPYDANAIRRLWKGDPNSEIAESAIEKSIQVAFHVPEPMLQDWRSYLHRLLRQAFPDHNDNDLYPVLRVFASQLEMRKSVPTPRNLVGFVNALGASYRQYRDDIPLTVQAYYELIRRQHTFASSDESKPHSRLTDALIAGDLPGAAARRHLGPDARDQLAAIHYGKDITTAKHLLLGPPVEFALEQGDGSALGSVYTAHKHALDVVEAVLERSLAHWAPADGEKVLHAAAAIGQSGILESMNAAERLSVSRLIVRAVQDLEQFWPRDEAAILGLVTTEQWARTIGLQPIGLKAVAKAATAEFANGAIESTVEAIAVLFDTYRKHDFDLGIKNVTMPLDASGMMTALEHAINGWGVDFASVFVPTREEVQNLSTQIKKRIETGKLGDSGALATGIVFREGFQIDAAGIVAAASERLNYANGAGTSEVDVLITLLKEMGKQGDEQLRWLVGKGHVYHHMYAAANDNVTFAALTALALKYRPDMQLPSRVGNGAAGHQNMIQKLDQPPTGFAELLIGYLADDAAIVFESMVHSPRKALREAVREMAKDADYDFVFDVDRVATHWPAIGPLADTLIPRIATDAFVSEVTSHDFDLSLADLYAAIVAARLSDDVFRDWVLERICELSSDVIIEDLTSSQPVTPSLLARLRERGAMSDLPRTWREGLAHHAKDIAAGEQAAEGLEHVISMLTPSQRELLADDLLDAIFDQNGEVADMMFSVFGSTLAKSPALRRDDSRVVRLLIEPIVKRKDEQGLRWLVQTMENDNRVFDSLSGSSRDAFRGVVMEHWVPEPVIEADQLLERIRAIRKWHKPKAKKTE